MSYIPTLVASLDTRLEQLAAEISSLEHARAELQPRTPTTPAIPRSRATQTSRLRLTPQATARKRSGSSLSGEQLQQLLADTGSGLSAGAIAAQTGVDRGRVLAGLRELETAGKVRRTGSRRTTQWLLITDEDRIAQRAAELERLFATRRGDRTQRRGHARAS
jgi:predicted Rossmann fold nucleotide-binding protein DprA/Smf involved in DNA uptake